MILKNGRLRKVVGLVDNKTVRLAKKLGIDVAVGSINKKHKHISLTVGNKFPGAHKDGSALRSRVVWWLRTGEVIVGGEIDIHHHNENKIDDRFGNLRRLEHVKHAHHHNPYGLKLVTKICKNCSKFFQIEGWRKKEHSRGSFCSQKCYHQYPKKKQRTELKCKQCKNAFEVIPNRALHRKFCSKSCSATYQWSHQ